MRRLCLVYKVSLTKQPAFIYGVLPSKNFQHCENLSDTQLRLTPSLVERNTSRTRFSQVLSMNRMYTIQIFVALAVIAYFGNPYRNLSDH